MQRQPHCAATAFGVADSASGGRAVAGSAGDEDVPVNGRGVVELGKDAGG
jgi:hypothetical protein